MREFSPEEWVFAVAASYAAAVGAVAWYWPLIRVSSVGTRGGPRLALALVPLLCLAMLYVVLQNWADPVSVVGHSNYILLFMAGGAAWVFGAWAGAFVKKWTSEPEPSDEPLPRPIRTPDRAPEPGGVPAGAGVPARAMRREE